MWCKRIWSVVEQMVLSSTHVHPMCFAFSQIQPVLWGQTVPLYMWFRFFWRAAMPWTLVSLTVDPLKVYHTSVSSNASVVTVLLTCNCSHHLDPNKPSHAKLILLFLLIPFFCVTQWYLLLDYLRTEFEWCALPYSPGRSRFNSCAKASSWLYKLIFFWIFFFLREKQGRMPSLNSI